MKAKVKTKFITDPKRGNINFDTGEITTAYKAVNTLEYNIPYIPYMPHLIKCRKALKGDEHHYFDCCLEYAMLYGKFNEVIEFTINEFLIDIIISSGLLDKVDKSKYINYIDIYINRLVKKGLIERRSHGKYYFNPLYVAKAPNNITFRLEMLKNYEANFKGVSFDDTEYKKIIQWIEEL